jgi:hypothetical protein
VAEYITKAEVEAENVSLKQLLSDQAEELKVAADRLVKAERDNVDNLLLEPQIKALQVRAENWGPELTKQARGDLTVTLHGDQSKGYNVVALWDDGRATVTAVANSNEARQVMANVRHT